MKGGEIIPLEELNLPFLNEEHRLLRSAIREFAEKEIIPTAWERDKNDDIKEQLRFSRN